MESFRRTSRPPMNMRLLWLAFISSFWVVRPMGISFFSGKSFSETRASPALYFFAPSMHAAQ